MKDTENSIDWKSIAGFRNIVVHDYLGINLNRIWLIIEKDLPHLKQAVSTMLNDEKLFPTGEPKLVTVALSLQKWYNGVSPGIIPGGDYVTGSVPTRGCTLPYEVQR